MKTISPPITITVTAPASVPTWAPAAGFYTSLVGANVLSAADPDPSGTAWYNAVEGQQGEFTAWGSGAFATDYGPHGAYLLRNGGHHAYWGNESYAFVLDSTESLCQWVRMTNPSPQGAPANSNIRPDGQPGVGQNYDILKYVPASGGGGTYGSMVFLAIVATDGPAGSGNQDGNGQGASTNTWTLNLFNTVSNGLPSAAPAWNFPTAANDGGNLSGFILGGAAVYDPVRKVIWRVWPVEANNKLTMFNWATQAWSTVSYIPAVPPYGFFVTVNNMVAGWCDTLGMMVIMTNESPNSLLYGYDPTTNTMGALTTSGTIPAFGSMSWCPLTNAFYSYPAAGAVACTKITPPGGTPFTSTWTLSTETFTAQNDSHGNAPGIPPDASPNPSFNRFQWVPFLRSFVYVGSRTSRLFMFRPAGT